MILPPFSIPCFRASKAVDRDLAIKTFVQLYKLQKCFDRIDPGFELELTFKLFMDKLE